MRPPTPDTSSVRIAPGFVAAFAALALLVHELHELAHTSTGRVLCGGWGPRDFNTWALPGGCTSVVPTLAGPLFSIAVMWVGAAWLASPRPRWRPLALALVLAANPFARLITAGMGGGDEGVVVRAWTGLPRGPVAALVALVPVALLVAVPVWRAWRALDPRGRVLAFTVLAALPMVLTGLVLFRFGNPLLEAGVLAEPVIAGTPALVWVVTLAALAIVLALRRQFQGSR